MIIHLMEMRVVMGIVSKVNPLEMGMDIMEIQKVVVVVEVLILHHLGVESVVLDHCLLGVEVPRKCTKVRNSLI